MSWRNYAGPVARKALRRLPRGAQHSASAVLRRLPRRPVLSVIVPVYNVEEYLDECLTSLRAQTLTSMQVILVDDGSTDGSNAICRRHAAQDRRIRVHRQRNAGLGAARNAGIRLAKGRYLTFLDSDDTLPTAAYATMVSTLDASGSDFAIGSVRRVTMGRFTSAPWIDQVHRQDRIGTTIDEFPAAVMDVIACNRMIRRSFWEGLGLSFPEGVAYEDHVPMMTAFVRAKQFDVLRTVTYHWRIRENKTSIGQQKRELQNLKDRLLAKEQAAEVLLAHASAQVRDAWLQRVLDLDLMGFVDQVEWTDDEYWRVLSEGTAMFLAAASEDVLADVRADRKVRAWLVANGRKDQLLEFLQLRRHEGAQLRTEVVQGTVYGRLPFYGDAAVGVPRDMYRLSREQCALVSSLREVSVVDNSRLRLRLWGYVRYVDSKAGGLALTVELVNEATGERRALPVEQYEDPGVTRWSGQRYQNHDCGACTVLVDLEDLVPSEVETGRKRSVARWRVELSARVLGVERTGQLAHRDTHATPGRLPFADLGPHRVVTTMPAGRGLVLDVRRRPVELEGLVVDGRTVSGTLQLSGGAVFRSVTATSSTGVRVGAQLEPEGADLRFSLTLPEPEWGNTPLDRRFWTVEVRRSASGRPSRVAWPAASRESWLGSGHAAELAATHTERGNLQLHEVGCYAVVDHLELRSGLVVEGHWVGPQPAVWQLTFANHRIQLKPESLSGADGRFVAVFPLEFDEWGLGPTPLPSGNYLLQVQLNDHDVETHEAGLAVGTAARAFPVAAVPLLGRLTANFTTDLLKLQVRRAAGDHVALNVAAPLTAEELGNYRQQALQDWYRDGDHGVEPDAVLFQCYRGETATDSELALHQELRRRGADLQLYWGVSDYSVRVPEGGIPLVIGSRLWYEKLARVGYLVNNIDFDRFFDKKPHQRFLETFHGYPFKAMGISVWAKTASERRIDEEVARRNAAWDVILTPTPEMNTFYRREFRYTGEILDVGYPRDDALVAPEAEAARQRTRKILGIHEGQTAVLYAPTWRDNLALSAWSARAVTYLDAAAASESLGDDYVLLMRGHNFNARTGTRSPRTARILDVTDYPEINDLVLASDVAVLDYSSLRFDYALTGKPMVFLVPDLAEYSGDARGFLYDYSSTAPGPLLETTEEVVQTLRRLDDVRREYGTSYEAFNTAYNYLQDGKAAARVADAFFGRPRTAS